MYVFKVEWRYTITGVGKKQFIIISKVTCLVWVCKDCISVRWGLIHYVTWCNVWCKCFSYVFDARWITQFDWDWAAKLPTEDCVALYENGAGVKKCSCNPDWTDLVNDMFYWGKFVAQLYRCLMPASESSLPTLRSLMTELQPAAVPPCIAQEPYIYVCVCSHIHAHIVTNVHCTRTLSEHDCWLLIVHHLPKSKLALLLHSNSQVFLASHETLIICCRSTSWGSWFFNLIQYLTVTAVGSTGSNGCFLEAKFCTD